MYSCDWEKALTYCATNRSDLHVRIEAERFYFLLLFIELQVKMLTRFKYGIENVLFTFLTLFSSILLLNMCTEKKIDFLIIFLLIVRKIQNKRVTMRRFELIQ